MSMLKDVKSFQGFSNSALALVGAGYDKLFEELQFDNVKGYGKAAGRWFNKKLLGDSLKIPRNGKQTFHSFRHNFINGLFALDPPMEEFLINQMSGHERGETMSAKRYSKDQSPDILGSYIARLDFSIPVIERFDIAGGLLAVLDALERRIKT